MCMWAFLLGPWMKEAGGALLFARTPISRKLHLQTFKLYHPFSQSFIPKPLTLGVRTRTRTLGDTVCSPQEGTKGNCCSLSKGAFRSSTLIWSSPSTLFTEMPIHGTKYLPKTCICILKLRTSHYTSLSKNVNINIKDPSISNPESCGDRHSWGMRMMMGMREEQEEEEEEEQQEKKQPYFPNRQRGLVRLLQSGLKLHTHLSQVWPCGNLKW